MRTPTITGSSGLLVEEKSNQMADRYRGTRAGLAATHNPVTKEAMSTALIVSTEKYVLSWNPAIEVPLWGRVAHGLEWSRYSRASVSWLFSFVPAS
jgi:hypothetical protein